jgi:hypothetical protein
MHKNGESINPAANHPLEKNPSPGQMSDEELLRTGIVAKYMCSQDMKLSGASRQDFDLQLAEIRAEWRTRFPRLPLSATLD